MTGSKKTGEIAKELKNPIRFVVENLYFSISEQCKWYNIGRNSYYYHPRTKTDSNVDLKEKIRAKYDKDPSSGSRRIAASLCIDGIDVNRSLVRRLMKQMNIKGDCL